LGTGLLGQIKQCITNGNNGIEQLPSKGIEVTDMNAVLFDAKILSGDALPVFMKCCTSRDYCKTRGMIVRVTILAIICII
jgi:hypothetical protein